MSARESLGRQIAIEHIHWAYRNGQTHMDIAESIEWAPHLYPEFSDLVLKLSRVWMGMRVTRSGE